MNMKLNNKNTPFRTVRMLRYSYCLFYAMAVWFGKPYRKRSYSSMGDKFEYFLGRFGLFILTIGALCGVTALLWNFPLQMILIGYPDFSGRSGFRSVHLGMPGIVRL